MPHLTASGRTTACRTSLLAELRILSAILQPVSSLSSFQPSTQCSGTCTSHALSRVGSGPLTFSSDRSPRKSAFFATIALRRSLHTTTPRRTAQPAQSFEFWPNSHGPASECQGSQDAEAQDVESTSHDSKQSGSLQGSGTHTCSVCDAELSSEDALDEHIVSCRAAHQTDNVPAESSAKSVEAIDWSIEQEKAKLDQVRRLEDDLRKARHELQVLSQRRQMSQTGDSILDVYSAALPTPDKSISKQDYLNFVDIYFHAAQTDIASSPDASPNPIFLEDQPYESQSATKEEPVHDGSQNYGLSILAHVDQRLRDDKLKEIKHLGSFIDLLLDPKSSYEHIFQSYQNFPSPGIKHIPEATIRTFLHRMSLPPRKTPTHMLRYLSIIDDMQAAKIPISRAEWNAAIHLSGKSYNNIGDSELRRSLDYWRKMEQEAGVRASSSTFNIMFDVAVKAGHLLFAKDLLREMTRRGTRLNRIGRVSHIWYCGKVGDADAVRQAYRDFVDAGEIVDTLVLNTVMVSLCNAGEGQAAEQIYERMKDMQLRRLASPANNSKEVKELFTRYPPPGSQTFGAQMASNHLRRILIHAPKIRDQAGESYEHISSQAHIRPDTVTYRTFLAYHAEKTGDLDRLTVLLDDMTRIFGIRMSSMTFLLLFKGFAMNGNTRHSKWSASRLNTVWEAYRSAMKASGTPNQSILTQTIESKHSDFNTHRSGKTGQVLQASSFFDSFRDRDPLETDTTTTTNNISNRSDLDELRSRAFDQSPWGRFMRDFAATPEQKEEADLDLDPGGTDEPTTAIPFSASTFATSSSFSALSNSPAPAPADDYFRVRPSKWLIIWALRAFATCTQNRRRVEEVYFELMDYWVNPTEAQRETVEAVVQSCLRDVELGVRDRQWWRRRQARSGFGESDGHGDGAGRKGALRMQW